MALPGIEPGSLAQEPETLTTKPHHLPNLWLTSEPLVHQSLIIGKAAGWGSEFVLFGMQVAKWSAVSNPAAICPVDVTAILYGVVMRITNIS